MDFSTWTTRSADALRLRRLVLGGFAGVLILVGSGAFIVLTSNNEAIAKEEEVVAVELAKEPEPEPQPQPEPEPPPVIEKVVSARPGPRLPKLEVPKEISDEKPEEKDPTPKTGEGDPLQGAKPGGGGTDPNAPETALVAPPTPPPPPPKPAVKAPVRITEDMPSPVVLSEVTPEYPSAARSAGIEGIVAVRVLVGADGSVKSTKVLKGPPELAPACEAAAKQWRFKPYVQDGEPTPFVKMKVCRYRLR